MALLEQYPINAERCVQHFAVRETASLGQQMLNAPFGINWLWIHIAVYLMDKIQANYTHRLYSVHAQLLKK